MVNHITNLDLKQKPIWEMGGGDYNPIANDNQINNDHVF